MQIKFIQSDYSAYFNAPITFIYDNVLFLSSLLIQRVPKFFLYVEKKFTLPPGKIIIVSINGETASPRHAISHLTCAKINLI